MTSPDQVARVVRLLREQDDAASSEVADLLEEGQILTTDPAVQAKLASAVLHRIASGAMEIRTSHPLEPNAQTVMTRKDPVTGSPMLEFNEDNTSVLLDGPPTPGVEPPRVIQGPLAEFMRGARKALTLARGLVNNRTPEYRYDLSLRDTFGKGLSDRDKADAVARVLSRLFTLSAKDPNSLAVVEYYRDSVAPMFNDYDGKPLKRVVSFHDILTPEGYKHFFTDKRALPGTRHEDLRPLFNYTMFSFEEDGHGRGGRDGKFAVLGHIHSDLRVPSGIDEARGFATASSPATMVPFKKGDEYRTYEPMTLTLDELKGEVGERAATALDKALAALGSDTSSAGALAVISNWLDYGGQALLRYRYGADGISMTMRNGKPVLSFWAEVMPEEGTMVPAASAGIVQHALVTGIEGTDMDGDSTGAAVVPSSHHGLVPVLPGLTPENARLIADYGKRNTRDIRNTASSAIELEVGLRANWEDFKAIYNHGLERHTAPVHGGQDYDAVYLAPDLEKNWPGLNSFIISPAAIAPGNLDIAGSKIELDLRDPAALGTNVDAAVDAAQSRGVAVSWNNVFSTAYADGLPFFLADANGDPIEAGQLAVDKDGKPYQFKGQLLFSVDRGFSTSRADKLSQVFAKMQATKYANMFFDAVKNGTPARMNLTMEFVPLFISMIYSRQWARHMSGQPFDVWLAEANREGVAFQRAFMQWATEVMGEMEAATENGKTPKLIDFLNEREGTPARSTMFGPVTVYQDLMRRNTEFRGHFALSRLSYAQGHNIHEANKLARSLEQAKPSTEDEMAAQRAVLGQLDQLYSRAPDYVRSPLVRYADYVVKESGNTVSASTRRQISSVGYRMSAAAHAARLLRARDKRVRDIARTAITKGDTTELMRQIENILALFQARERLLVTLDRETYPVMNEFLTALRRPFFDAEGNVSGEGRVRMRFGSHLSRDLKAAAARLDQDDETPLRAAFDRWKAREGGLFGWEEIADGMLTEEYREAVANLTQRDLLTLLYLYGALTEDAAGPVPRPGAFTWALPPAYHQGLSKFRSALLEGYANTELKGYLVREAELKPYEHPKFMRSGTVDNIPSVRGMSLEGLAAKLDTYDFAKGRPLPVSREEIGREAVDRMRGFAQLSQAEARQQVTALQLRGVHVLGFPVDRLRTTEEFGEAVGTSAVDTLARMILQRVNSFSPRDAILMAKDQDLEDVLGEEGIRSALRLAFGDAPVPHNLFLYAGYTPPAPRAITHSLAEVAQEPVAETPVEDLGEKPKSWSRETKLTDVLPYVEEVDKLTVAIRKIRKEAASILSGYQAETTPAAVAPTAPTSPASSSPVEVVKLGFREKVPEGVVSGMRNGAAHMNNVPASAYGQQDSGWLGNPHKWAGNGGTGTVQDAIAKFKADFLAKVESDAAFRQAVLDLRDKGMKLGYYRPEGEGQSGLHHLQVVQEWLAGQPVEAEALPTAFSSVSTDLRPVDIKRDGDTWTLSKGAETITESREAMIRRYRDLSTGFADKAALRAGIQGLTVQQIHEALKTKGQKSPAIMLLSALTSRSMPKFQGQEWPAGFAAESPAWSGISRRGAEGARTRKEAGVLEAMDQVVRAVKLVSGNEALQVEIDGLAEAAGKWIAELSPAEGMDSRALRALGLAVSAMSETLDPESVAAYQRISQFLASAALDSPAHSATDRPLWNQMKVDGLSPLGWISQGTNPQERFARALVFSSPDGQAHDVGAASAKALDIAKAIAGGPLVAVPRLQTPGGIPTLRSLFLSTGAEKVYLADHKDLQVRLLRGEKVPLSDLLHPSVYAAVVQVAPEASRRYVRTFTSEEMQRFGIPNTQAAANRTAFAGDASDSEAVRDVLAVHPLLMSEYAGQTRSDFYRRFTDVFAHELQHVLNRAAGIPSGWIGETMPEPGTPAYTEYLNSTDEKLAEEAASAWTDVESLLVARSTEGSASNIPSDIPADTQSFLSVGSRGQAVRVERDPVVGWMVTEVDSSISEPILPQTAKHYWNKRKPEADVPPTASISPRSVSPEGEVSLAFSWHDALVAIPARVKAQQTLAQQLKRINAPKVEAEAFLKWAEGKDGDSTELLGAYEAEVLPKLEIAESALTAEYGRANHEVLSVNKGQGEYKEYLIRTPFPVPGQHGGFQDPNLAGWFRAREHADGTLEVQEVQSELFQKNKRGFIEAPTSKGISAAERATMDSDGDFALAHPQAAFLNMMLKDQTWVPVFINAITQWAKNQGFTKVRFPTGETAARVEGHQVLADRLAALQERRAAYEARIQAEEARPDTAPLPETRTEENLPEYGFVYREDKGALPYDVVVTRDPAPTSGFAPGFGATEQWTRRTTAGYPEGANDGKLNKYLAGRFWKRATRVVATPSRVAEYRRALAETDAEIQNLKTQGIEKLAPIEAFYEKRVASLVNRLGATPVTDANGNTWREVNLARSLDAGVPTASLPYQFSDPRWEQFSVDGFNYRFNKGAGQLERAVEGSGSWAKVDMAFYNDAIAKADPAITEDIVSPASAPDVQSVGDDPELLASLLANEQVPEGFVDVDDVPAPAQVTVTPSKPPALPVPDLRKLRHKLRELGVFDESWGMPGGSEDTGDAYGAASARGVVAGSLKAQQNAKLKTNPVQLRQGTEVLQALADHFGVQDLFHPRVVAAVIQLFKHSAVDAGLLGKFAPPAKERGSARGYHDLIGFASDAVNKMVGDLQSLDTDRVSPRFYDPAPGDASGFHQAGRARSKLPRWAAMHPTDDLLSSGVTGPEVLALFDAANISLLELRKRAAQSPDVTPDDVNPEGDDYDTPDLPDLPTSADIYEPLNKTYRAHITPYSTWIQENVLPTLGVADLRELATDGTSEAALLGARQKIAYLRRFWGMGQSGAIPVLMEAQAPTFVTDPSRPGEISDETRTVSSAERTGFGIKGLSFTDDERILTAWVASTALANASGSDVVLIGAEADFSDTPDTKNGRNAVDWRAVPTSELPPATSGERRTFNVNKMLEKAKTALPAEVYETWLGAFDEVMRVALNNFSHDSATMKDTKPVEFNRHVLRALSKAKLVSVSEGNGLDTSSATVTVPVDMVEKIFEGSSARDKLVKAGRKASELSVRRLSESVRDIIKETEKAIYDNRGWLGNAFGRSVSGLGGLAPFTPGHGAYRRFFEYADESPKSYEEVILATQKSLQDTITAESGRPEAERRGAYEASPRMKAYIASLYGVTFQQIDEALRGKPDLTIDGVREMVRQMRSAAQHRGQASYKDIDVNLLAYTDVAHALAYKAIEVINRNVSDPAANRDNLADAAAALATAREIARSQNANINFSHRVMWENFGLLPEGRHDIFSSTLAWSNRIATTMRWREAFVAMLAAKDSNGDHVLVAVPNMEVQDAADMLPDELWGALAKSWAQSLAKKGLKGPAYDPAKTGQENAKIIADSYTAIASGSRNRMGRMRRGVQDDYRVIEVGGAAPVSRMYARRDTDEDSSPVLNSMVGGTAAGYATRMLHTLGMQDIHPTLRSIQAGVGWTRMANMAFSGFFAFATGGESMVAASGLSGVLGNVAPRAFRRRAARGGWSLASLPLIGAIMGDDLKNMTATARDFMPLLRSNDPQIVELRQIAHTLGISTGGDAMAKIFDTGSAHGDMERVALHIRKTMGRAAEKAFRQTSRIAFEAIPEATFEYLLEATTLAALHNFTERMRAEAEARGKIFEPREHMQKAARYIQAEFGPIDHAVYPWLTPKGYAAASTVFMSLQWTMGALEAAGAGTILHKITGHEFAPEVRKFMLWRWARMLSIVIYGLPALAQVLARGMGRALGVDDDDEGKWFMWNNEIGRRAHADITPFLRGLANLPGNKFLQDLPVVGKLVPGYRDEQTTGRRRYYMRWGKQGYEVGTLLVEGDATRYFVGKLSSPASGILEHAFGRNLAMDWALPFKDQNVVSSLFHGSDGFKDSATVNYLKKILPFSLAGALSGPVDNEAGILSALGPVSKGVNTKTLTTMMEDRLRKWADRGSPEARHLRVPLGHLVSDLARMGYDNGYDGVKIAKQASINVANRYYQDVFANAPGNPSGKVDLDRMGEALDALARLSRGLDGISQSMQDRDSRLNKLPGVETWRQRRQAIDTAFRRDKRRSTKWDPRDFNQAALGGNVSDTLDTDALPEKILGYTVAHPSQLTPEDHQYFQDNPQAGGYFEQSLDPRGASTVSSPTDFLDSDELPETVLGYPVLRPEALTDEDLEYFRDYPSAAGFFEQAETSAGGPRTQSASEGGWYGEGQEDEVKQYGPGGRGLAGKKLDWDPTRFEDVSGETPFLQKAALFSAAVAGRAFSRIPGGRKLAGKVGNKFLAPFRDPSSSGYETSNLRLRMIPTETDPEILAQYADLQRKLNIFEGRDPDFDRSQLSYERPSAKMERVLLREGFDMPNTDDEVAAAGLERTGKKTFKFREGVDLRVVRGLGSYYTHQLPDGRRAYRDLWDVALNERSSNFTGDFKSKLLRALAGGLMDPATVEGVFTAEEARTLDNMNHMNHQGE